MQVVIAFTLAASVAARSLKGIDHVLENRAMQVVNQSELWCPRHDEVGLKAVSFTTEMARKAVSTFCAGNGWPEILVPHIYAGGHFTNASSGRRLKSPGVVLNYPMIGSGALLRLSISHTENATSLCPVQIGVVSNTTDPKERTAQCESTWTEVIGNCSQNHDSTIGGVLKDGCRVWSISAARSDDQLITALRPSSQTGPLQCKNPDAAGRSYGPADLKWCQCRYANFETTALFKMKDGDSDCRQVDSAQLLNP